MRGRSLAVMAALVLALGAFIWLYERDLPTTAERETHGKRVFGDLEADDVREVTLEQGGRTVRLVREAPAKDANGDEGEDGGEGGDGADDLLGGEPPAATAEWRLASPITARADRFAVDGLLSTLLGVEKGRTLEGIDRAQYGLAPPAGRVTLVTEDGTRVLEVGREVPGSDQRIVALAGGAEGWAVSAGFWSELVKPAADWRSRELFPGQRAEIERVTLRSVGQSGGQSVLLARRGEEYWVEAPFADRADQDRVEELLGALTALRAEEFPAAPPPGLDPPQATIEVVRKGRAEPFRVALGAATAAVEGAATPTPAVAESAAVEETGPESASAASEPTGDLDEPPAVPAALRPARVGGQLVTVAAEPLAEAAARPPAEWRSRAWTSFAVYEVDRVEVTDGAGRLTLVRDEGDWKRTGVAGQREARIFYGPVSDLLAALADARAERVLAPGDAAAAGAQGTPAGRPVLTVKLVSGENEAAREQTLTLAGPVAGGQLAARSSDRQAVLMLPGSLLAELRGKVAAVRQAEPLQPAPAATPSPAG